MEYYISYKFNGSSIAGRKRHLVPRKGDVVKLQGKLHSVVSIMWDEDKTESRVTVELVALSK